MSQSKVVRPQKNNRFEKWKIVLDSCHNHILNSLHKEDKGFADTCISIVLIAAVIESFSFRLANEVVKEDKRDEFLKLPCWDKYKFSAKYSGWSESDCRTYTDHLDKSKFMKVFEIRNNFLHGNLDAIEFDKLQAELLIDLWNGTMDLFGYVGIQFDHWIPRARVEDYLKEVKALKILAS